MTRRTRLRIALVIAAVAVVLGTLLLPSLFDWRAGKAFARIQKGDAASKVALFLGVPSSSGGCGPELRWDEDRLGANDGRCVREDRFKVRRGTQVVGYSADGHVVSKYLDSAQ
ncbi:MAG: hypothetical protein P4L83_11675 [Nevskia sp.]|nr:hypothetical protein [Nevskia sp.]